MARRELSDEEMKAIMAGFPAARRRGRLSLLHKPHARSAEVDLATRMLHVHLTNDCSFAIPVDVIPSLRGVSDRDLLKVELDTKYGFGLRWDKLDIDLEVGGLARVVMGGISAMRELAAIGGSARTPAKAAAARENGKKGGRPRQRA
ncbi:MAG: DUF2442 domain-containing protein [Candidatus Hydrogenedentales bacterium]